MHEYQLTPEIKAQIANDDFVRLTESLLAFAQPLLGSSSISAFRSGATGEGFGSPVSSLR
jgi:hypothetical protein